MSRILDLTQPRRFGAVLAGFAAVLLVMAVLLSVEVRTNLRRLASASSENIQWTLSQMEVEMLEFTNAAVLANTSDTPDLELLRLEFDILFNRVQTLYGSPFFEQIVTERNFRDSLKATRRFLDDNVPLMDGPDDRLRAALPDLIRQATDLRLDVRKLAVVALGHFAGQSDQRRSAVADTLIRLAALATMLLTALIGLVIYMLSIYRQARNRGIALAQANQRMNTILTTSLDGVIVTDHDGQILEFNEAAQRIFDIDLTEARGRSIDSFFASDNIRDIRSGARQPRNDSPTPEQKTRIVGHGRVQLDARRADGTVFPAEIAIQSAFDGKQDLFVAFLRDISRRVADEKELVRARDRALAGEQAKASFLTVMSHEIRTPLNGLLGNLALLQGCDLTPEQDRFARNMDISGNVLMRHVDSVLDLARFEAGKAEITPRATNLTDLVQNVTDGLTGLAERGNTALGWHWVGPPAPWLRLDPAALEQVLLNLLGNALKFTPRGQVTIELELSGAGNGTQRTEILEIRVIDTGLGIPEADLERVFEDFVTRDVSFGRLTGGTGLGLGIARRIVEAMGGEIGVESTQGEGSVFWLRLPVRRVRPRAGATSTGSPPPPARALDILVVEDNEINRDVACQMLRREGHTVTCAADGKSGINHAHTHRYDVILMDISMPVMDGFQAARSIRNSDGASRDSPIVAVSANVLQQDQHEVERAGMNGFLAKPLAGVQLRDLIQAISSGDPAPAAAPPDAAMLIDTQHLLATRTGLGEDVFDGLLGRFCTETDTLLSDLAAGPPAPEATKALAARCHKSAGSAAVFGLNRLRNALLQMETALMTGETPDLGDLVSRLAAAWDDSRAALHPQPPGM